MPRKPKHQSTESLAQISSLKQIATDLHWMARRYCDGRQSYAVGMFNDITRRLIAMGVLLNPTADGTVWARDAGGRAFDGLSDQEAAQGNTPDWLHGVIQRRNEELEKENAELKLKLSAKKD